MTRANVETLKQTLTIWHRRKISVLTCLTQIEHDKKIGRLTPPEQAVMMVWLADLFKAK